MFKQKSYLLQVWIATDTHMKHCGKTHLHGKVHNTFYPLLQHRKMCTIAADFFTFTLKKHSERSNNSSSLIQLKYEKKAYIKNLLNSTSFHSWLNEPASGNVSTCRHIWFAARLHSQVLSIKMIRWKDSAFQFTITDTQFSETKLEAREPYVNISRQ